jgi:ribose transport system substrate-binding protein
MFRVIGERSHRSPTKPARRRVWLLAVAAFALTVAAGCSSGSSKPASSTGNSSASSATGGHHYRIALVTGDNHDPFFISMRDGAQAEAAKLGVSLDWTGPAMYDPSLQIPVLSSVLTSHPNFLLVCPVDLHALNQPIRQFDQAGIPVMTLDSDISDTSVRAGNITSNNSLGGKEAADFLAKAIGGHGQVAVLNEQPGVSTTDLRQSGFIAEIKKYPGITYVGVGRDNDDPTVAARAGSALLTRYPHLAGFFATDDGNGSGAIAAVKGAGLAGQVKIVAYDAEPDEVQALESGQVSALVVQKPYLEGELGVMDAVEYLNGNHHAIPSQIMQTAIIATKANISSPQVSQFIYK